MPPGPTVTVNGRTYRYPRGPVVIVCIDGSEPAYFDAAIAAGRSPAVARFRSSGLATLARSVVPSFTNPNNLSIVTGVSPAGHGIPGKYFYDGGGRTDVMVNEPPVLRCETLL